MSAEKTPPMTTHRVRWSEHEELLDQWKRRPPTHPQNPRYRAYEFRVRGKYSLFESVINIFRDRGWLDAPPADYKWAEVTVYYKAPKDPMDKFAGFGAQANHDPAPDRVRDERDDDQFASVGTDLDLTTIS